MENINNYLHQVHKEAALAVALLDAFYAFGMYNKVQLKCGSQFVLLDFTEEIEVLRSALALLNVDAETAVESRLDGIWF